MLNAHDNSGTDERPVRRRNIFAAPPDAAAPAAASGGGVFAAAAAGRPNALPRKADRCVEARPAAQLHVDRLVQVLHFVAGGWRAAVVVVAGVPIAFAVHFGSQETVRSAPSRSSTHTAPGRSASEPVHRKRRSQTRTPRAARTRDRRARRRALASQRPRRTARRDPRPPAVEPTQRPAAPPAIAVPLPPPRHTPPRPPVVPPTPAHKPASSLPEFL